MAKKTEIEEEMGSKEESILNNFKKQEKTIKNMTKGTIFSY